MPSDETLQTIDNVFRSVNREIWIVTAAAGEKPDDLRRGGLVATWVSQASLDAAQPVVAVGIAPNHYTAELIDASGGFALHLITPDQIDLAWRFAIGSGRDRDKLAGVATSPGQTGSPVIDDCLSWLDCRVISRYDTGDRVYYWADVVDGQQKQSAAPLRANDLFAAASDDQLAELIKNLHYDVEVQRPLAEAWRKGLKSS